MGRSPFGGGQAGQRQDARPEGENRDRAVPSVGAAVDAAEGEWPGIWRQGDYFRVTPRGGTIVAGRSDATLNRFGVRIGTAEIYTVLDSIPEVDDAIVVNLDLPGGRSFMPMFVKLADGRSAGC